MTKTLAVLTATLAILATACGGGAGPTTATTSPTQAAAGSPSPTVRPCCTKVVAAYSNISADDWIPWYAFEKGIFKDNGLEIDLQSINGGAQTSAALISGSIQIGQFGGSEALSANAGGGDLVIVANLAPVYPYKLYVQKGIKTIADLKAKGLAHPSRKPLPHGAVRIGRLSSALSPRQYDLILGLEQLLIHTGIFGPSNSGKSASFYMNILRDWSQTGSVLVMDIKGELYAHTARYYDQVYRLDLENPNLSDLWNPLPRCLKNGELAHSLAAIVVGYEPENMKVNDSTHYWISGETALMKALCLHLPTIAVNPTLPMIKELPIAQ